MKTFFSKKPLLALAAMTILSWSNAFAQNPYLPLWEYIPDGEPYVFEDPDKPGEMRVYVYGSHDSLKEAYCGLEQVVWSAPVNDLSNWRYDGLIFKVEKAANGESLNNKKYVADVLYAPDVTFVTEKDGSKTYYLFPNNQGGGRNGMIAKSKRPDGPFEITNWDSKDPRKADGIWGFDPACFVDDDGRVYGYWGFERSYGAEIDPETMCTVKPGTKVVEDMVSSRRQEGIFGFFEASSIRKIQDKYVFIYSRWSKDGEFGMPGSNYTLAYAYSDNPLGPWTYGGTIIDGRGRGEDENGKPIPTAHPGGNTHGSICEINGRWWVFYHRQCGTNQYARQAMVAPISVCVEPGKGGKVMISEGEYTSEGFMTEGLNPLNKTAAGLACYYTGPKPIRDEFPNYYFSGSYVKNTYLDTNSYQGPYNLKQPFCPVINNTSGSVVGYKYFNFSKISKEAKVELQMNMETFGVEGTITVMLNSPYESKGGKVIGTISLDKNASGKPVVFATNVKGLSDKQGKQALFFVFNSKTPEKSLCEIYDFQFVVK
ncbi:MAG: family 43 glycosylhydrolase [Bacteroidales bacterium]|nr:family 43 glycosylhydrolase [Bacteroidales bacterium]